MSPSENNILDIQTMQRDRQQSKGFKFKLFDEMAAEPVAKRWLIKGILARGETSAWIAPPGGMKSALLAQASICVASGLDWLGKRNKGAAGVVYFALERSDLVERRMKAHKLKLGLQQLPIAVVPVTFDLIKPDSVNRVIETISAIEQEIRLRSCRHFAGLSKGLRQQTIAQTFKAASAGDTPG